ncbi:hypothetical protein ACHQM5_027800 [Ranunculus cassubicifolius]
MLNSPPSQPPPSPLSPPSTTTKENRTTLYCLLTTSLLSLLLVLSVYTTSTTTTSPPFSVPRHRQTNLIFNNPNHSSTTPPPPPSPPRLAYFISATNGETETDRITRLLYAIYHPRNHYLLHLDLTAPQSQRESLSIWVESHPIFGRQGPFNNVYVVGKADFAYPNSPSSISNTLHGAALFLKYAKWQWFVSLSASDYPLVTQDDLLHILSYLPNNFNFMEHSSDIESRISKRMKRISVDPGIYLSVKSEMFYATQQRDLPNAFRLFAGSTSAILSREFLEFCITGSSNLPRTVLMYLSNMPSSQALYFPTVLCNARDFKKTIINYNPHFTLWDNDKSPIRKKIPLGVKDFGNMIQSGSAFASGFPVDDPVLDDIDNKVLSRKSGNVVPGGWCLGESHVCSLWGDTKVLRPGPGAKRLERRLVELLSNGSLSSHQCVFQ